MVIPYFFDATIKWDGSSASTMGLKTIYTSLLILIMALHGCSLLDNAGAHYPEQPFPAINALSKSFFSPTETCILNGHGYKCSIAAGLSRSSSVTKIAFKQ